MSSKLDDSRRQLRNFLIPRDNAKIGDDAIYGDADQFPRSKVMRFAINPRNRKLMMLAGSVLAVVATRAVGAGRIALVADIARSFSNINKQG